MAQPQTLQPDTYIHLYTATNSEKDFVPPFTKTVQDSDQTTALPTTAGKEVEAELLRPELQFLLNLQYARTFAPFVITPGVIVHKMSLSSIQEQFTGVLPSEMAPRTRTNRDNFYDTFFSIVQIPTACIGNSIAAELNFLTFLLASEQIEEDIKVKFRFPVGPAGERLRDLFRLETSNFNSVQRPFLINAVKYVLHHSRIFGSVYSVYPNHSPFQIDPTQRSTTISARFRRR